jgi:hypothetical protein
VELLFGDFAPLPNFADLALLSTLLTFLVSVNWASSLLGYQFTIPKCLDLLLERKYKSLNILDLIFSLRLLLLQLELEHSLLEEML